MDMPKRILEISRKVTFITLLLRKVNHIENVKNSIVAMHTVNVFLASVGTNISLQVN